MSSGPQTDRAYSAAPGACKGLHSAQGAVVCDDAGITCTTTVLWRYVTWTVETRVCIGVSVSARGRRHTSINKSSPLDYIWPVSLHCLPGPWTSRFISCRI